MRKKVDFRTGSRETYNDFCTTYPDIHLTFEEWKRIIYMYPKLIRDYIIETGRVVTFPRGIGDFSINKRKPIKVASINGKDEIKLPINWKRSKERKKVIYEMNHHTDGYKCHWIWLNPNKSLIWMSAMWKFKANRENARLLGSYLKSGKRYHDRYCEWKK